MFPRHPIVRNMFKYCSTYLDKESSYLPQLPPPLLSFRAACVFILDINISEGFPFGKRYYNIKYIYEI